MSDSRRLIEIIVIGGLAGLAVAGMVYAVRAMARDDVTESAAALIEDCRDRISSLRQLLDTGA